MYKSMLNNKVPELWASFAYPSLKPLSSWVENLKQRIEFLRMWLIKGKAHSLLAALILLPLGLLNSPASELCQEVSNRYRPIELWILVLDILHDGASHSNAGDGVYFYGLFMESG